MKNKRRFYTMVFFNGKRLKTKEYKKDKEFKETVDFLKKLSFPGSTVSQNIKSNGNNLKIVVLNKTRKYLLD